MDTLVLSAQWEPMYRVTWRTAFEKLWADKVEVLEYYSDRFIRWVGGKMAMPSVIRFVDAGVHKQHVVRHPKFNKYNIWLRDGKKCAYCTKPVSLKEFTKDHVIPRKQGGETRWKNIVACCDPCNGKKRDRTPEEAGMTLHVQPHRPATLPVPLANIPPRWAASLPALWKNYMG